MKNKTILIPNSFYGRTVPAIFHQRLHRFAAQVETEEGVEGVHIPNSGRLAELLFAGNQVGLHFEGRKGRKTRYTLVKAANRRRVGFYRLATAQPDFGQ